MVFRIDIFVCGRGSALTPGIAFWRNIGNTTHPNFLVKNSKDISNPLKDVECYWEWCFVSFHDANGLGTTCYFICDISIGDPDAFIITSGSLYFYENIEISPGMI